MPSSVVTPPNSRKDHGPSGLAGGTPGDADPSWPSSEVEVSLLERIAEAFAPLHQPRPDELRRALTAVTARPDELRLVCDEPSVYPYGRKLLYSSADVEVLAMNWAPGRQCAPHDHGASFGWIQIVAGDASHELFTLDHAGEMPLRWHQGSEPTGRLYFAPVGLIHSMGNPRRDRELLTLHAYSLPISGMRVYDLNRCAACVVSDDCGAWWPLEDRQRLQEIRFRNGARKP
jgi:cysteine dioxygenase